MSETAPPTTDDWVVEVLGPCRLVNHGTKPVEVLNLTDTQRLILASLFVAAPSACSQAELCDLIWRHHPPPTARAALQNQISRLRHRSTDRVITTLPGGYALGVATDADRFRAAAGQAEEHLRRGDAVTAFDLAEQTLALWRGRPLPVLDELEASDAVTVVRRLLDETRRALEDTRLAAGVAMGRAGWSVREAERLVAVTPLDEGRWLMLVQALHQVGRRGDALAAVDRARRALRTELGLDLGAGLRAAETTVLGGSPRVDLSPLTTPVRGRAAELQQTIAQARAGRFVMVTGESGIGRSTVLAEAARRLRSTGTKVVEVGVPTDPGTPFALLDDVLAELRVQPSPGVGALRGFVDALHRFVERTPLVIVVDDVHDAGPSSLHALVTATEHPSLGAIVSSVDVHAIHELPRDVCHVELPALTDDALGEMVRDLMHADTADVPERGWWRQLSGGNPFLLRCLVDDLLQGRIDPTHAVAVSGSRLTNAVQRRIDQLGALGRAALETAAVCGPSARADVVVEWSSAQGLALAVASGMLREVEGRLLFAHGATEVAAYHGVSAARRQELHLRLAQREEQAGADPAVIAHHWLGAGDLEPLAALRAAQTAARWASRHGAHRDAARWYQRSLLPAQRSGAQTDVVRGLIGHGDELRLAGDPRHAEHLLAAVAAAERLGDAELIADAVFALVQLGATSETGDVHERAVVVAQRVLEQLPLRHPGWARVAAAASIAESLFGNVTRARQLFVEAESRAQGDLVRLQVLPATYLALGLPGDLEQRELLTAELLTLAERHDDPVAEFEGQHLAFSNALQRAHGMSARAAVARMAELVTVVGDVGRRWQYLYCGAALAHLDGDLDLAERRTEEAQQLFAPVSPSRAFAARIAQLLAIRAAQGRLGELADTFAYLVASQPEVAAWHPLYAVAAVHHDPSTARHHAEVALEVLPRDFTWLAAHLMGAFAAARVAHPGVVLEYRRRLEPWAHRVAWQGTCAYGPVAGALADLAEACSDRDEARHYRRLANRLAESLGAPVFTTPA